MKWLSMIKEQFLNNQTQEEYEEAMESYESIDELLDDEPVPLIITPKGNKEVQRGFRPERTRAKD